jgi:4'-phosphopantetheinyl transferase EntD
MGVAIGDIPRRVGSPPVWPTEIVGSLAHDSVIAAAIIAGSFVFGGVGIDVEPPEPLDSSIVDLVASPQEWCQFHHLSFGDKAIFSIKEAIFKALYPSDGLFLDFLDVELIWNSGSAVTRHGRVAQWCVLTDPWVVSAAWWTRTACHRSHQG